MPLLDGTMGLIPTPTLAPTFMIKSGYTNGIFYLRKKHEPIVLKELYEISGDHNFNTQCSFEYDEPPYVIATCSKCNINLTYDVFSLIGNTSWRDDDGNIDITSCNNYLMNNVLG